MCGKGKVIQRNNFLTVNSPALGKGMAETELVSSKEGRKVNPELFFPNFPNVLKKTMYVGFNGDIISPRHKIILIYLIRN